MQNGRYHPLSILKTARDIESCYDHWNGFPIYCIILDPFPTEFIKYQIYLKRLMIEPHDGKDHR